MNLQTKCNSQKGDFAQEHDDDKDDEQQDQLLGELIHFILVEDIFHLERKALAADGQADIAVADQVAFRFIPDGRLRVSPEAEAILLAALHIHQPVANLCFIQHDGGNGNEPAGVVRIGMPDKVHGGAVDGLQRFGVLAVGGQP